jgi:tetratricopeptide (TPR) repeat protein
LSDVLNARRKNPLTPNSARNAPPRSQKAKGITGAGVIIGTPEYMSPEQAEAKETDPWSDIYSLGIVLYEMLTGKLPFEGDTPLSIAMKHKGEIPKDPRELNPQIPAALSRLILKCLEKEEENRFPPAEEVIDDEIAEAHTLKAQMTYVYDLDWEGAEKEFNLALELNPNSIYAHMWYGIYLAKKGQMDEAMEEQAKAFELDPLNIVVNYGNGAGNIWARRYDMAIRAFEKTLSMDQNFVPAHVGLAEIYLLQSRYEEALEELDKAWELSKGSSPDVVSLRGMIHAKSGNRMDAEKALEELFDMSQQRHVSSALFASLYMALGQKVQAFEWLDKAYIERSEELTMLKIDPYWDDLRPDPRFAELLQKIGLE